MERAARALLRTAAAGAALLLGAPAAAEIYRWVDAGGNVHFTEDLQKVPPEQRRAAESAAGQPARSKVQVYEAPPASVSRSAGAARRTGGESAGRVYRIRVEQAGSSMRVPVRVNGRLDVPFLIDTGATDVVLPAWAAQELGLDLANARSGLYSTANGVIEQKLVRLDSVALGGAVVDSVPAAVSASMSEGLLGLSFFNHFKYDVDPVDGVVTLVRNDLAETGVLRGGKSEAQWRQSFAFAAARIAQAESELASAPSSRTRRREALAGEVERLRDELSQLHAEADDARVPPGWRD